jgi:hypothetical protein
MKTKINYCILIAAVTAVIGFAVYRVIPYTSSVNANPADREQKVRISQIQGDIARQYDMAALAEGADRLHSELASSAASALQALPPEHRPDERSIQTLSTMFADYIIVCRTGDFEDYAAWARAIGREPIQQNSDANDWARFKPLDATTVEAWTLFIRGQPTFDSSETVFASSGPSRELRAGGPIFLTPHDRSVIELSLLAQIPYIDSDASEPIRVGVVFANDGPGGAWTSMMVVCRDRPAGFVMFLPPA